MPVLLAPPEVVVSEDRGTPPWRGRGSVRRLRAVAEFVYDEDVALRYDAAVPVQAGEVEFYLALAREAEARGLRTLEIACGTGRIAISLARQGARLVGLDSSSAARPQPVQRLTSPELDWA